LVLEKIVVGVLATNCYIIAPSDNAEAAVVDPGADASLISERLRQFNLKLKFIINTHGHYDHVSADSELAKENNVPVYMHSEDIYMLNDSSANLSLFWDKPIEKVDILKELEEDQILYVGGLALKIIHTPGHTKGSISILVKNKLFTGDLLFKDSVGRTDFPGSSFRALIKSLEKIANLPDNTQIYPGHGPVTVLGKEKQNNMFLKGIVS